MNVHSSRLLLSLSSLLLATCTPGLGSASLPEVAGPPFGVRQQVRDEADPSDSRSCDTLGRLDITFQTEKKGPPTVGMVVSDPRGRRIGFDPIRNHGWQELPQADGFIDCDAPDGEGACHGTIQICGPVSGSYKLEVIARQDAEYSLNVSGRSQEVREQHRLRSSKSEAELKDVSIRKGSRDMLVLNYSRDFESKINFQLSVVSRQQEKTDDGWLTTEDPSVSAQSQF